MQSIQGKSAVPTDYVAIPALALIDFKESIVVIVLLATVGICA